MEEAIGNIFSKTDLGSVRRIERIPRGTVGVNFLVTTDDASRYFIKMYSSSEEEVRYEQAVLGYLGRTSIASNIISPVSGVLRVNNSPAVVYKFVEGGPLPGITGHNLETIAGIQAVMHSELFDKVIPHAKIRFPAFDTGFLKLFRPPEGVDRRMDEAIASLASEAAAHSEDGFARTVIHDDFSPANILLSAGRLVVIDFDDAHPSLRACDIATTIAELLLGTGDCFIGNVKKYIDTYNSAAWRKISGREYLAVPFLVKRRLVFMWSYYMYKSGGVPTEAADRYSRLLDRHALAGGELADLCGSYYGKQ